MGWRRWRNGGAHISDVPGLVKQISTPADENASIMSVAAMLSMGLRLAEPQGVAASGWLNWSCMHSAAREAPS